MYSHFYFCSFVCLQNIFLKCWVCVSVEALTLTSLSILVMHSAMLMLVLFFFLFLFLCLGSTFSYQYLATSLDRNTECKKRCESRMRRQQLALLLDLHIQSGYTDWWSTVITCLPGLLLLYYFWPTYPGSRNILLYHEKSVWDCLCNWSACREVLHLMAISHCIALGCIFFPPARKAPKTGATPSPHTRCHFDGVFSPSLSFLHCPLFSHFTLIFLWYFLFFSIWYFVFCLCHLVLIILVHFFSLFVRFGSCHL